MPPHRPIHIALTFNEKYWALAYTVMRSICLSTRLRAELVFHLCHRTLAPEHKADFAMITAEFGSEVRYYDIDRMPMYASIASRAAYNRRLSNLVYARLLFGTFIPEEVTRLTYLDCDIMVYAPIERIAEIDLQGHPIAAVNEPHSFHISMGRDMRLKNDLFDAADPYFNAGLIVIDMAGWRAANILEKLEAAIADGTMDRIYYDQDFLNLVFKNDWLELDQRWNMVDPRPIHQTLRPYLLHYTGAGKPWKRTANVAFLRAYRHVMTNELYNRYMLYRWRKKLTWPIREFSKLIGKNR